MKFVLVLLVCLSLAIAKPTTSNNEEKSVIKNFINFSAIDENLMLDYHIVCNYCQNNFEELHEKFQNPIYKLTFVEFAKLSCTDQECIEVLEAFAESVSKETDLEKGCLPVCRFKIHKY